MRGYTQLAHMFTPRSTQAVICSGICDARNSAASAMAAMTGAGVSPPGFRLMSDRPLLMPGGASVTGSVIP
jgi:hypothetical protein